MDRSGDQASESRSWEKVILLFSETKAGKFLRIAKYNLLMPFCLPSIEGHAQNNTIILNYCLDIYIDQSEGAIPTGSWYIFSLSHDWHKRAVMFCHAKTGDHVIHRKSSQR